MVKGTRVLPTTIPKVLVGTVLVRRPRGSILPLPCISPCAPPELCSSAFCYAVCVQTCSLYYVRFRFLLVSKQSRRASSAQIVSYLLRIVTACSLACFLHDTCVVVLTAPNGALTARYDAVARCSVLTPLGEKLTHVIPVNPII